MKFGWETKKDRILIGIRMSADKKLEGIRLMNELADKVLSDHEKILRRKLREAQ